MSNAFVVLIVLAMVSVLAILALGMVTMIRGGEFSARYSNKLMRMRVAMQFIAVVLIVLAVLVAGGG